MLKSTLLTTALVLSLGLGTAASIAVAQEPGKPSEHTGQPEGGMGNHHGGMMGTMSGENAAQMQRMVENCNRMMGSMMQDMPAAPATPEPEKKG